MKRIFRDEREVNEIRKIQSDGFQYIYWILILGIFIQVIMKAPPKQYFIELLVIIFMGYYSMYKRMKIGSEMQQYQRKVNLRNSIVSGSVIGIVILVMNLKNNLERDGIGSILFGFVICVLIGTCGYYFINSAFAKRTEKRKEELLHEYEED